MASKPTPKKGILLKLEPNSSFWGVFLGFCVFLLCATPADALTVESQVDTVSGIQEQAPFWCGTPTRYLSQSKYVNRLQAETSPESLFPRQLTLIHSRVAGEELQLGKAICRHVEFVDAQTIIFKNWGPAQ